MKLLVDARAGYCGSSGGWAQPALRVTYQINDGAGTTVEDIQDIISKLKNKGIGILITDHRVRETLSITDRAYIMDAGVIKISGTSAQLANDPQAREIYLGDKFKLD